MKSLPTLGLILALAFNLSINSCSKAQKATTGQTGAALAGKKVLIVYLSRTNNTKAVAQMIKDQVGGSLVGIELVNPYPQNYQAQVAQVVRENAEGFLPPLKTRIDSMSSYDVVFIGFPTWDMKMPPPMKSFLRQYQWQGKTVIPFNTNAGYGVGSGFSTVKELCTNSTVLDGFSVKGGIERDGVLFVMEGAKEKEVKTELNAWLRNLKLIQ